MCVQGAAENARSRMKTGLPAKDGDEDLIDYYYMVMHPNTAEGKDRRREKLKGDDWSSSHERLVGRFGAHVHDGKF